MVHGFLTWMTAACVLYPAVPNWLGVIVAILVVETSLGQSKKIPPNSMLALVAFGLWKVVLLFPAAGKLLAQFGAKAPPEPDLSHFPAAAAVLADETPAAARVDQHAKPPGQGGSIKVGAVAVLAGIGAVALALASCGCPPAVAVAAGAPVLAVIVGAVTLGVVALGLRRRGFLVLVGLLAFGATGSAGCGHGTDAGYHVAGTLAVIGTQGVKVLMPYEHQHELELTAAIHAAQTDAQFEAAMAALTAWQEQRAKVHAGLRDAKDMLDAGVSTLGLVEDGMAPPAAAQQWVVDGAALAVRLVKLLSDFGVKLPSPILSLVGGK